MLVQRFDRLSLCCTLFTSNAMEWRMCKSLVLSVASRKNIQNSSIFLPQKIPKGLKNSREKDRKGRSRQPFTVHCHCASCRYVGIYTIDNLSWAARIEIMILETNGT